jgi:hypothetical protein
MTKAHADRTVEFEVTESRTSGPIDEKYSRESAVSTQIAKLDINAVSEAVGVVIDRMAGLIKPREGGPSQCEVEFAVKVAADGNIIIAKIGGEVSLKVKVTWKHG